MTMQFEFAPPVTDNLGVSPQREVGAYEALWDEYGATFKSIFEKLCKNASALPSEVVEPSKAREYASIFSEQLKSANISDFGVRVFGAGEYPNKLRDAEYPIALLYYRGWWDLVNSKSVAVVGTRKPSPEGRARARRLVKELVKDDFTIVSGLAQGIDTVAHTTAIAVGGRTIAVIGTPLTHAYPKQNRELQELIAKKFLVISQVPVKRWKEQGPKQNRLFFPARNITMSALTEATIIVEAGETSGTLIQARHALKQKRKLFILESNFHKKSITWPHKFEELGAIRVKDIDDIRRSIS